MEWMPTRMAESISSQRPMPSTSMANYLREHGWKCSMDRSSQLQVILDYNKSFVYANTVLAVAEKLRVKPRVKQ